MEGLFLRLFSLLLFFPMTSVRFAGLMASLHVSVTSSYSEGEEEEEERGGGERKRQTEKEKGKVTPNKHVTIYIACCDGTDDLFSGWDGRMGLMGKKVGLRGGGGGGGSTK